MLVGQHFIGGLNCMKGNKIMNCHRNNINIDIFKHVKMTLYYDKG